MIAQPENRAQDRRAESRRAEPQQEESRRAEPQQEAGRRAESRHEAGRWAESRPTERHHPQGRRAEHASDTRGALLSVARRLFASQGYDSTGTEQIVGEARVTRGALYHHFRDKSDLFRTVMAEAAGEVAGRLTGEHIDSSSGSPFEDVRAGVGEFLDVCVAGDFQRIVLVDGPRVLGTDAWDELVDRYGRSLLEEWLSRTVDAGDIRPVPVQPLARLIIAMLAEASLAIARSPDPAQTRAEMGATLDRLLTGLRCAAR